METYTKADMLPKIKFMKSYRKKRLTPAMRVTGKFEVITREGTLKCPDGYVAVDTEGWPYPIHKDEFEKIYEEG